MSRTALKMDRWDIEQRAPAEHRMMLGASAAYVSFDYALREGWINQEDYDAAREHYGNLWNYCGD